jgi:hypothetical protein
MDDLALSNNGNVPSTYKVLVSPSNLELLSPTLKPLAHELRQAITHHATYEGYSLAGEAVVAFEHDQPNAPFSLLGYRLFVRHQLTQLRTNQLDARFMLWC